MRIAVALSFVLVAACSSEKPQQDELVTLDGSASASQGSAPLAAGGSAPAAGAALQAVDAEGSKLEPLLSSVVSAAGLDTGACKFSPAKGALPVLVASKAGGKAMVSVSGRQVNVTPSGIIAATGGSFSGEGVTLMVSASGTDAAGNAASMQVNDADGPAFAYKDGFWACN